MEWKVAFKKVRFANWQIWAKREKRSKKKQHTKMCCSWCMIIYLL